MLAQQQLLKGSGPLDMGAFGLDGMRGNPGGVNQGPRGGQGKNNVRILLSCFVRLLSTLATAASSTVRKPLGLCNTFQDGMV